MKETISEINKRFKSAAPENLSALIEYYGQDERQGVLKAIEGAHRRMEALTREEERLWQMFSFEREHIADYPVICGIDEAGRGPLAGPVVAAAVILDMEKPIAGVNDSKQLSEKKREQLYDMIMTQAISVGVGIASPAVIDDINILQADYEAMRQAVAQLSPQPKLLLNDAVIIPGLDMKQISIIKGDAKSLSIAAASIVAKVTRDRMMAAYASLYPEYGFDKHKGYGTAEHIAALKKYGPSPIHRRSFITHFTGE